MAIRTTPWASTLYGMVDITNYKLWPKLFLCLFINTLVAQTQIGQNIEGSDFFGSFGDTVGINADGTVIAVGEPSGGLGVVRIYENIAGTWTQIGADIVGLANNNQLGISISFSDDGTIVALGASGADDNGDNSGHVRIFQNVAGTWTQIGSPIGGEAANDGSGSSVSLSADGSIVAIGASGNDLGGDPNGPTGQSGHVRVYQNIAGTWTQIGQDIDGIAGGESSGRSVSLSADGSIVAIGAPLNDNGDSNTGQVRIYQNIGGTWTQIGGGIDGENANDQSGNSISLSSDGTIVAIGALQNDDNGSNSGHTRIYQNIAGTWTQIGQDIDGENTNDLSGSSISLSSDGSIVAIGASQNDGNGSNSGHTRIYRNVAGTWTQLGNDIDGEAANDRLGDAVALSKDGTTVIVGSPGHNATAIQGGQAQVFTTAPLPQGTTYTATGWDNGVPDASTAAIVASNYTSGDMGLGSITALNITVNTGITLTISDDDMLSTGDITINGTLIIENTGSVLQGDSGTTTNNGTIEVRKTTPALAPRDFIMLASPMSGETRAGVYGSANRVFGINSTLFTPDPAVMTAVNFLDTDGDYFFPATTLNTGEGYLVFPQAVTAPGNINYAHTYTQGTLNNGTINKALVYNGPATANNFNLVGNPYPSAIDTDALITANAAINEVYFWEHITVPNENLPGFGNVNFSMDDISVRNLLGGTPSANGGSAPGQYMASGQGFAVFVQQSEAGTATPLTFTNAMRDGANNTTVRSAAQNQNSHKLWLRLDSDTYTITSTTLIGFSPQATPSIDAGYDSNRIDTTISLFSTLESGEQLAIQGREVFDPAMEIALGFGTKIPEADTYTISIDHMEGFDLENNDIFLIDNVLNTSTDLKAGLYAFAESETIQPNRFTLIFQERALNVDETVLTENTISFYPNPATDQITLAYTGNQSLNTLRITDIQGRLVKQLDLTTFNGSRTIDISTLNNGLYFFQVDNGQSTVTTKVIIK